MRPNFHFRTNATLLAILLGLVTFPAQARKQTALDRYVHKPDPHYKWEVVRTDTEPDFTASVIELTSQAWRSEAEVDRPVWKHWLTVVRPANVRYSTGFLFITGGANDGKPAPKVDPVMGSIAAATGSVVAVLRMVPNQPLVFGGDGKRRVEDDLISYTWDKYLRGGDDEWLARLPMTKSAVRAMDAVSEFTATPAGGGRKVERFVVAGASKRGWTTWTTAAVDPRVVALVPIVIDLLNVEASFDHHYRAYGFYAPAVKDYERMHIMDWQGTPRYRELMKITEPYEYRDRLTMPKFIVNASGDQFFLPDSSQFYFDDLKGEKYLRYVPNADHSLRRSDAWESVAAYYEAILNNRKRPEFTWRFTPGGDIEVKTKDKPVAVKLWQATNPNARDFRLETIGPAYQSSDLAADNGRYVATVPKPEKGWTAFFVELTYPGGKYPLKFTTGVRVTPDTLPHGPYQRKPIPQ